MTKTNPLSAFVSALRGTQEKVADITARLDKARNDLSNAETEWGEALLAAEVDGDAKAKVRATKGLAEAKDKVRELEALLLAAQRREARDAEAARIASEHEQDQALKASLGNHRDTAHALAKALEGYATAYQAHLAAEVQVRNHAVGNPRVRQDLLNSFSVVQRVADELARLSATSTHVPPGTNGMAKATGNPADLTSFADIVARDHAALVKGLR